MNKAENVKASLAGKDVDHVPSGYWLHFDDFNAQDFQPYCYYIPFKWEWVVAPHNDVPWQSHFETLMEINLRMIKENAPMIWIKKSDRELEKCFVVWW